jgi:hypothetical protein
VEVQGNVIIGALLLLAGVFVLVKAVKTVVKLVMLAVIGLAAWLFIQGL